MWNLKEKKKTLIDTELVMSGNRLVVVRGESWQVGQMDEGGQKVQNSNYKISKSWGRNVQHGDYS